MDARRQQIVGNTQSTAKIRLSTKNYITTFQDIHNKTRDLVASRPVVQEIVKDALMGEMKGH